MFCIKCGTSLQSDAKFCHKCGQRVPHQMPVTPYPAVTAVSPSPTHSRRLHPLLSLLLVLLLFCGGMMAVLYFWFGLNRTNQVARIVPADTVAFISISPSVWQLPQLRHAQNLQNAAIAFTPLVALPGVIELVDQIDANLPLDLEIDPAADILPWIGREVSVAILADGARAGDGRVTLSRLARSYDGPPILLAAVTRNQAQSDAFLTKVRTQWEQEGVEFADSLYQDVPVMEIVYPRETPLAMATFNDLLVVATDVATLQQAIARAQGGGGVALSEVPAFQETVDSLKGNRLAHLYLDAPQLLAAIPEEARPWQLQSLEHVGLAAALTAQGLRLDYALHYNKDKLSPAQIDWLTQSASPNDLIERAPHDTLLYLSGQNLALLWQTMETPETRVVLQNLAKEIQIDRLGTDPITDILAQLTGEFALALVPAEARFGSEEMQIPELLGLVQADDERAVAAMLESLLISARASYVRDEIENVSVYLLSLNRNEPPIGYGFIKDMLVASSSQSVLAQVIQANSDTLADNALFATAIAPLPRKNHGYFYLDVAGSFRLLEEMLGDFADAGTRPFLEGIQAISGATLPMDNDFVQHGTLHVVTNKE